MLMTIVNSILTIKSFLTALEPRSTRRSGEEAEAEASSSSKAPISVT